MNYTVKSIQSKQTHEWLLKKHYAKRLCNIRWSFGLFDENRLLVGIITFGNLASPAPCVGVCGEKYRNEVIELNRVCVNDDLKANATSYLISQSIKKLPKPLIIISYADTSKGHIGYIYQATNWIYTGLSAKRTDPNHENKNIHNRNSFKKGLPQKARPRKHRYIYIHGSKTQKKHRLSNLNYKIQKYPKGETNRYDASHSPTIQIEIF